MSELPLPLLFSPGKTVLAPSQSDAAPGAERSGQVVSSVPPTRAAQRLAHRAAVATLVIGAVALWLALLERFVPLHLPLTLTALQLGVGPGTALVALAAALWLAERPPTPEEAKRGGAGRHQASGFCALAVLAFGLIHLGLYSGGLQIDAHSYIDGVRQIISVAPGSALGFALAALALLLLDAQTRFLRLVSTQAAIAAGAVAVLVTLGHLFRALGFAEVRSYAPMMPVTALMLAFLCVGILCARPNREPVITIASAGAAGVTARRLLSALLILPLVGWICAMGQEWDLYGTRAGNALYSVATLYGFAGLIWWNARRQRSVEAEQRRTQNALQDSEERYRLLFAHNPLPMWLYDTETLRFLAVNDAAVAHYGYSRAEFLQMTMLDIRPAEDGVAMRAAVAASRGNREAARRRWRHRKKDGTVIAVESLSIDARFATEGRPSRLVLAHDVTAQEAAAAQIHDYSRVLELQKRELQIANERLKALATRDGLTGLLNHRTFYERLASAQQTAARHQQPLSLLLLDVDHFKAYNDDFGHPAGDVVLRTVAEILENEVRASDTVARYGGEEFAVLLPQASTANALIAAERLRMAVEAYPWQERAVTVSIGVASLSLEVGNTDELVRAADTGLYASKRAGRNCVMGSVSVPPAAHRAAGTERAASASG